MCLFFVTGQLLPYYCRGFAWGATNAGLQRDSEGVYWHAINYSGWGIYRYKQTDIYASVQEASRVQNPYPIIAEGIKLSAMFLDEKNDYIYIFLTTGRYHGVCRAPISAVKNGGYEIFDTSVTKWELIDSSPASPENTTADEGVYVRQFTSDGDYVYWAYIAEEGSGYKSGIKRVNATGTPKVEYVVEDVEAYGICSYKYDDTLGVEDIKIENDSDAIEVARYDIYGRKLSQPTTGVNIIKMSNGTTLKVFVK